MKFSLEGGGGSMDAVIDFLLQTVPYTVADHATAAMRFNNEYCHTPYVT